MPFTKGWWLMMADAYYYRNDAWRYEMGRRNMHLARLEAFCLRRARQAKSY